MKIKEKKTNKSYLELLRNRKWQEKRLRILHRDDFKCRWCGCEDDEKELQVHHIRYYKDSNGKFIKPWEYDDHELFSVCKPCHEIADTRAGVTKAFVDFFKPVIEDTSEHINVIALVQSEYLLKHGSTAYIKLLRENL